MVFIKSQKKKQMTFLSYALVGATSYTNYIDIGRSVNKDNTIITYIFLQYNYRIDMNM